MITNEYYPFIFNRIFIPSKKQPFFLPSKQFKLYLHFIIKPKNIKK